jgi:hypothetical protein
LAQGANWVGPVGFPRTDAEVKAHVKDIQAKFSKAKHIVLVGGGAVGFGNFPPTLSAPRVLWNGYFSTELAGEIKDIWPVCLFFFDWQ